MVYQAGVSEKQTVVRALTKWGGGGGRAAVLVIIETPDMIQNFTKFHCNRDIMILQLS